MNCPNKHLKVFKTNSLKSVFFYTSLFLFSAIITYLFFIQLGKNISNAQATSTIEAKVVELHNIERQKQGIAPLSISSKLEQAAYKHNLAMVECSRQYGTNACFSHQVSQINEPALKDRLSQSGYIATAWGENIAWGQNSADSVMTAWMNSSGHKANILNSNYNQIGCNFTDSANGNYQGIFWTCDFGKSSVISSSVPTVSAKPITTPKPTVSSSVKPISRIMVTTPKPKISTTPTPTPIVSPTPTPIITVNVNRDLTSYYEVRVSQVLDIINPFWCNYIPDGLNCY